MKPRISNPFRSGVSAVLSVLTLGCFTASSALAAIRTWDGGSATSGQWSVDSWANWDGTNLAIASGDDLVFGSTNTNGNTLTSLGGGRVIKSLTFQVGSPAYDIRLSSTVTSGTAQNLTFNSSNTGITVEAGDTSSHNIGLALGSVVLQGNLTTTHNGSGTLTISRPITGTGFGVTKDGNGTMTLSGANTYNGATQVNAGILSIGNLAAKGTTSGITVGASGIIGLGVVPIAPSTTHYVATEFATLFNRVSTDPALTGNLTGYSLDNASGVAVDTSAAAGVFVDQGTGNALTANRSLIKIGSGTYRMNQTNTYAGATIIKQGTLSLGAGLNGGSLSTSSAITVESGATFAVSKNSAVVQGTAFSAAPITGAGNFSHTGGNAGTGVTTLNAANTYTGNTTVTGGTLNITGTLNGTSLLLGTTAANTVVNVSNDMTLSTVIGGSVANSFAVYNQTAGTVTSVGNGVTTHVANGGGYGYLNLTGGSYSQTANRFSVTNSNGTAGGAGVVYVGGTGTLNLTGTTSMIIGYTGGAPASLTVGPGGTVDRSTGTGSFWLTVSANAYGVLNVAGGDFNTAGSGIRVGNGATSGHVGFVNLAKGTLTLGLNGINGITSTNTGSLYSNYAGGTLKAVNNLTAVVPATNATLTSTSTVFGPITNNNNASTAFNTQIGTTSNFAGGLIVDSNSFGVTYTSPLLGATGNGVKQSNITVTGGSGYIGAPMVQFTGGTGTPAAGYAVISGGAVTGIVITSPGDYSVDPTGVTLIGGGGTGASVALSALTANASDSGLTKINSGALTLTAANTYAGPTLVSGGTLALSGSGSVNISSGITINGSDAKFLQTSSAAVSPTVTLTQGTLTGNGTVNAVNVGDATGAIISNNDGVAGASLSIGALTFNGAATVDTSINSPSAPIVTTSLASNVAGTVTINATSSNWTNNTTYDLISYGGGSIGGGGFAKFALGTLTGLSARQAATATLGNSGTAITLAIAGDTPYWTGDTDNKWNTTTANNWKLLSNNSTALFLATDNVLFNDNATGAGPITVDINLANVAPTSTTFDNSSKDYVLTSTGGFGISSGSLTKNGTGKLTIKTVNTYPGSTTINGGTLVIDDGSIASSSNIVNNATLEYKLNTNPDTYANVISGTGSLTKSGSNTLTLSGANTFTGGLNIAEGVVTLGNASAAGDSTSVITFSTGGATNATLQCDRASTTTITNPVNVATGSTGTNTLANVGSANVSFNSAINIGAGTTLTLANNNAGTSSLELGGSALVSGDGSVATSGTSTGNLIFRGANTYSGGTTLGGSSLHVPAASTNGPAGSPTDGNFGTGNINIGNISIRSTTTADTTIGNTLTLAGDLTAVTSGSEKSLIFSGPATLTGTRTLTSNVGNTVASKSLIFSGNIGDGGNAHGITKAGTGVLTLSGTNNYSGATTISAGTLLLGSDSAIGTGTLIMSGGNLDSSVADLLNTGNNIQAWDSDFTFTGTQSLNLGTGAVTMSADRAITVTANTLTVGGSIGGGAVNLTKLGAGILTLSGSNSYSGPTAISAGTLQISAPSNLGDGSATNTISLGAATLRSTAGNNDLGANRAITLTGNARIQADADTLTVSGSVTNDVNSLALLGAGNITVSGVIGAGATPTGALTIGSSTLPANVTLSGNNLFTGNVTLPASNSQPKAVLTLTNSGSLGVGPKTVTSQGSNGTNGGQIRLQNNISFASDISFTVSGFTIYNDSGSNTINGNIAMAGGAGATYLNSTSGTLTINGNMSASATLRSLSLRGAGSGVINGIISNGSTVDLPVLKDSGTGTWTLTGANTYGGGTTVTAGTLALGANDVLPDASAVTIGNGTLDAATFTDTVGTLDVTSTGKINLGTGAALAFADSSAVDWTGGSLDLTGTFDSGVSLRFGDGTGTGLTPAQLSSITATGFTDFALNGTGFLTATAVGGGFSSWITDTFTNGTVPGDKQGPNDDFDNDGISNLVEYAIAGQDPTVSNASVGTFAANVLSFSKRLDATGLTYAIQDSTDLGIADDWAEVTGGSYVNDATTISYTLTPGAPVKNFVRLQVLSN